MEIPKDDNESDSSSANFDDDDAMDPDLDEKEKSCKTDEQAGHNTASVSNTMEDKKSATE